MCKKTRLVIKMWNCAIDRQMFAVIDLAKCFVMNRPKKRPRMHHVNKNLLSRYAQKACNLEIATTEQFKQG